jgi:hypothetical protein
LFSVFSNKDEEEEEVLQPTKDGLGWICGKEIDVSVNESIKSESFNDAVASSSPSSSSVQKDVKKNDDQNLEDEIGKGKLCLPTNIHFLVKFQNITKQISSSIMNQFFLNFG